MSMHRYRLVGWLLTFALLGATVGTYAAHATPWTEHALEAAPAAKAPSAPNPYVLDNIAMPKPGEAPYQCRGYERFDESNPPITVMEDRISIQGYEEVTVGNGRGTINWRADPLRQPAWRMWLHSLRWVGALISESRTKPASRQRVETIFRGWRQANPFPWTRFAPAAESTMHRLNVLNCFRIAMAYPHGTLPASYAWLDTMMGEHLDVLAMRWTGANHATDQSIAMLGVACNLKRTEFIDLAVSRLEQGLASSIDEEGATNEQSTGYANMNYFLWSRASATLKRCQVAPELAASIEQRRSLMIDFLAHAHTPMGAMVQIGDTDGKPYAPIPGTTQEYVATRGARGVPPAERVKVYSAGYVFGRSGWGRGTQDFVRQSMYALRFGAATAWHGHSDHTAITWFTDGRPILIDPGYGMSPGDKLRPYITAASSHNQLTVPEMKGHASPTELVDYHYWDDREVYTLRDRPVSGVVRTRYVLIHHNPDFIVVHDIATSEKPTTFTQHWHHAIGSTTEAADDGTTTANPQGERTRVSVLASSSQPTITTDTGPAWVDYFSQQSHSISRVTVQGTEAKLLTLITPRNVRVESHTTDDGATYKVAEHEGRSVSFSVSHNGRINP